MASTHSARTHIHPQLIFYCPQSTLTYFSLFSICALRTDSYFHSRISNSIDQYVLYSTSENNQQKIGSKDFIHSIHIRDTLYCCAIKFNIYTMCTE